MDKNKFSSWSDIFDGGIIIVTLIGSFSSLSVAVVAVWISNKNTDLMKKGGGNPLLVSIDRAYQIAMTNGVNPKLDKNGDLKIDTNHNLSLYNIGLGVALNVRAELYLEDKNNVLSDLGINLNKKNTPLRISLNSEKYKYLPLHSYRFVFPTRDYSKGEVKFKIEWRYMFDIYMKAWEYMQRYSVVKLKIYYQDVDEEKYEDIYSIKFAGDRDCFNINFIKVTKG